MKLSLPGQPILLPSPVLIIGTYGADGKPNIMNAAWGGIASSTPPYMNVSIREATLSYHNIQQTKAFTVNIPSERYVREADFVGLVSGRSCDKFEETRLTPEKSKLVNAPIVKEFPYALECNMVRQIDLGRHTMFIGEIVGIIADSEVLGQNQLPDIEKVHPMLFGSFGSPAYYGIGDKLGNAFSVGNELRWSIKEKSG
ncbi:MAG: flavin reductase family protein [Chloroflexota bacterium]|nr:flavin reductase family protein [Anaerolineales bacterium]